MIGGCVSVLNKAYFDFGAVTTVDINSQKVFEEVCFSWSKRFTLGASATDDIVINAQSVTSDKTVVVLPVIFTAFGAGPLNIDMYFGVDSDEDGTLWAGGNRDNRSVATPNTTIRYSPTINSVGVKTPFEFMVPSDGVPATASLGGQTKEDLIFIARKDGKYMFRIVNTEAAAASCVFAMSIFEATK